jgi:hypothetical protein
MTIKTKFNIGQKVYWVSALLGCKPSIIERTIGYVRVEITDAKGQPDSIFDNFKAKKCREEKYMMEETGIGSGNVYPVDQLFATRQEAEIEAQKYEQ